MATVLTVGQFTYDNVKTNFNVNIDESIENGRHKLAYSLVTAQTPTGTGYRRTLNGGTFTIAGQSISVPSASVYNGYTVKNGTIYTDNDSAYIYLSLNVGGEVKSGSVTIQLTPINSSVYHKDNGAYVEYIPYVKDSTYSEVEVMVKENGMWGEY